VIRIQGFALSMPIDRTIDQLADAPNRTVHPPVVLSCRVMLADLIECVCDK
jgi:hypothetical protein